ncbi:metal ABC transporter permease [Myxococcota bacterium]|nr:metal ABC transporter permease [Myxococcota bacterium]MCZ7619246.1 metal ABC transporter permease [Myxococcota bacterium]
MIQTFLDSWALFHTTYLAGGAIAVLLSLVGVWIVAREQIFLGAAIAQASALGIAALLWFAGLGAAASWPWLESRAAADACAVAASVTTALLTAAPSARTGARGEARTAWIFLVAASLPMLLLAHSPHGLEEVHRLMFSTLLGAAPEELWSFAGLALLTVLAVWRWHDRLRLLAMDPEMAAAVGMQTRLWTRVIALWLGVAIGLSIRVSGLIYTFGCLVLPMLVARNLCREVRPMLVVAPLVAASTTLVAFFFANHTDVPPAHAAVALLCALVPLTWPLRKT